jgi:hypothetical protein
MWAKLSSRLASAAGRIGTIPSGGSTTIERRLALTGLSKSAQCSGGLMSEGRRPGPLASNVVSSKFTHSPEMSGWPSAVRGGTYLPSGGMVLMAEANGWSSSGRHLRARRGDGQGRDGGGHHKKACRCRHHGIITGGVRPLTGFL